jgi:integrase
MWNRNGKWYTQFWHEGRRYTKSWGTISKTVAREKDSKFKTEIREGKGQQKAKRILFEHFAEKYLEVAKTTKKVNSYNRNTSSVEMLKPFFNGKLIHEITPFMAEQYKKARKEVGKMPATINRDLATLNNMLNKAVDWGYLPHNPISRVKKLQENNEKMWVLSFDEEQALLKACDERPQRKKYLKDLVLLALNTGLREAELFNLRKLNVDMKKGYIRVVDTKNNENRLVPTNDTAREILDRRQRETGSDYVFCNRKNGKLNVLTNAFWQAVKNAGLERWEMDKEGKKKKIRFRFHDCRHTFGSRLGMAGVDLKTIMEVMGHKSAKVTMRYQHPTPEHKVNAVKILDQITSKSTTGRILYLNN